MMRSRSDWTGCGEHAAEAEPVIELDDQLRVVRWNPPAHALLDADTRERVLQALRETARDWILSHAPEESDATFLLTKRTDDEIAVHRAATEVAISRVISHDLNNLLACVLACARQRGDGAAASDHMLELIEHTVTRILELLLPLREAPATRDRDTTEVDEILQRCTELLAHAAGPLIVVTCQSAPFVAAIAPSELQQAVLNLGMNAIEAMPHGGRLLLKNTVLGDHTRVTVADTGIGIKQDRLETLLRDGGSTKGARRGIGLSIVRRIVARSGGSLAATSTVNAGSQFSITLRRANTVLADRSTSPTL